MKNQELLDPTKARSNVYRLSTDTYKTSMLFIVQQKREEYGSNLFAGDRYLDESVSGNLN